MSWYKLDPATIKLVDNVNTTSWRVVIGLFLAVIIVLWVMGMTTVSMAVAMVKSTATAVVTVKEIPKETLDFLFWSVFIGLAGATVAQFGIKRFTDKDTQVAVAQAKALAPAANAPTVVNQGATVVNNPAPTVDT